MLPLVPLSFFVCWFHPCFSSALGRCACFRCYLLASCPPLSFCCYAPPPLLPVSHFLFPSTPALSPSLSFVPFCFAVGLPGCPSPARFRFVRFYWPPSLPVPSWPFSGRCCLPLVFTPPSLFLLCCQPPPPPLHPLLGSSPLASATGPAAPRPLNLPPWSGCVLRDRVRYAVRTSESGDSLGMLVATE